MSSGAAVCSRVCPRAARATTIVFLFIAVVAGILLLTATGAHAAPASSSHASLSHASWGISPADPTPPSTPAPPTVPPSGNITIGINGVDGTPSQTVLTLVGITLLSIAPALLIMMTSFTKIFVVLAMTRNALSLQSIPPNQVIAGLALFLSLFIMWPVLTDINTHAVQPYLTGHIDFTHAVTAASEPLKTWMLKFTRQDDIALMTRIAGRHNPPGPQSLDLITLIPAFIISELRSAFIIGFVIFVPFLVIDLVVSAALMSMGMMMLPPVMISLPFKILLFVLVDGWGLVITSLVKSYAGG
ncbi:MAG: flagellar biosynthesis protein FliP [Microbacteriaceae bacterium]|nr:MAG: flagellar biosynthesis protein FliP [Microbacteriaceae bacterium]